jgi:hypothetical protein
MAHEQPATDIGNLHVIDYYLHMEMLIAQFAVEGKGARPIPTTHQPAERPAPDDWSRYDGELL